MLLWIGFALMTAGVVAALLRPLLRTARATTGRADNRADVNVYRDQLSEIETDTERGLISPEEASAARTELARRLLRAAEGGAAEALSTADTAPSRVAWSVYLAGALVPLVAVGVYLAIGSPEMPGQPHAERVRAAAAGRSIEDLVGLVESRLRQHPEDGQGWDVIAPVYVKAGRFRDAADAYGNAIRILGETPKRLLGLSEALILSNNGLVVEDARKVLLRLTALEPSRPEAAFWLAMAKEQDGDVAGAISGLEALLGNAPPDAPWKPAVETRIGELKGKLSNPGAPASPSPAPTAATAAPPARGPTADEVGAAQQLDPQQRADMIARMVQGLAERLEKGGRDLDGWQRLARAYKVMGREADAKAAIAKARANFPGDAAAQTALDELARSLGFGS